MAIAGGRLYVTHFLSGRLSVIDTTMLATVQTISTGLDNNLSQSVVISGNRAYLPQTRSNSLNPALLFDTTVFPIVSVIDLDNGQNLSRERIALDVADRPVNMPIGAALTASGKLYVANAGSDDVSVIDLQSQRAMANIPVGSTLSGSRPAPMAGSCS